MIVTMIMASVFRTVLANKMLFRNKCQNLTAVLNTRPRCNYSTILPSNNVKVYRSLSRDIYENLALEEWMYENTDFTTTDILLVWQSKPCVVIGRHQNPWMEADVTLLERDSISLARRSSGGGAVYHDEGNLNLSFLKDRTRYNRKDNLALVVNALTSKWNLDLSVNERDDIMLDGIHKVSGSAAKLSRNKSYHHFTLLHSVEQSKLSKMLSSPLKNNAGLNELANQISIDSRSTKSVPSPVQNLQSRAPEMAFDLMVDAIIAKFIENSTLTSQILNIANPLDEQLFPGVSEIHERLQSWEWMYGKTPKFSINIDIPPEHSNKTGNNSVICKMCVVLEKGRLASFMIDLRDNTVIDLAYVLNLKGMEINKDNLKFFTNPDILLGQTFSKAYPRLDVKHMSDGIQKYLLRMFDFL